MAESTGGVKTLSEVTGTALGSPGMGDKSSGAMPRYLAVATQIGDEISSLPPHASLPSERDLAERYEVSRMTARKSVDVLEKQGRVYRRPPHGTFVSEPRVAFRMGSFSREVRQLGRAPSARLLWARRDTGGPAARTALGLADGEEMHVIHRLRCMDGEPLVLETSSYPSTLTAGLLDEPPVGSVWDWLLDEQGIALVRTEAEIEVVIIDDAGCRELGVRPASTGLMVTRQTFDAQGRCVEYAQDVYRSDRAAFRVTESLV